MFRPRVIPCLLLHNGGLVKTKNFADPRYLGDPINAVKIFNDAEADELIFLDIDASKNGQTIDPEIVKGISDEAFMPFAVGGGINHVDDIRKMIDAGAEKVIINSAFYANPSLVEQGAAIFGSQAITLSIDAQWNEVTSSYNLYSKGASVKHDVSLEGQVMRAQEFGAGEIMINAIHKDGTRMGYDAELIDRVSKISSVPIIACGGANSIDDFAEGHKAGASALAAGSMFVFVGRKSAVMINYPELEDLNEVFNG
ncbi:HisA/HisF-related TIM barrel protein [Salibacteraceae bacterium]|jgi:imidazole glycerol-phosphate synthase subunit HisF|nr:HisA/HisF-related TIM barrel protein [Salibacteraceae bacterium]MDB4104621.1 HisA/HisF-related TIM barrel protein [Salibacteraceae bacterium]MDB9709932.1 HisA/HisF-related TIM barrel protein [Salibacteraceae bacterium]